MDASTSNVTVTYSAKSIVSSIRITSIPDFINYIYFPIVILEKEPVFPFF